MYRKIHVRTQAFDQCAKIARLMAMIEYKADQLNDALTLKAVYRQSMSYTSLFRIDLEARLCPVKQNVVYLSIVIMTCIYTHIAVHGVN